MKTIYLDNNATTYLDPVVVSRMQELSLAGIANPASQHRPGRHALHLLEGAKHSILDCVGASNSQNATQLVLTSGGTEANNLAVFGLLARRPGIAIVGATDHPSVIEAARYAVSSQDSLRILPVDSNGICDFDLLESWLVDIYDTPGQSVSFVSVMLGNNETGVLQDLKSVCRICRKYDVPVHSDVVQAIGKIPVDMHELGLSALTLTAHKIHGPVGIGALILGSDVSIEPMLMGGGQQLGMRAGTEPVIPAVGLASCLEQTYQALTSGQYESLESLRNEFENTLTLRCEGTVIGASVRRLPHTSNIAFVGVDRQALQMALDLQGIACSTGSACSSGSARPSGSLVAMQLPDEIVQGSLRFSFSRFTTARETTNACEIIASAVHKCRVSA